MRNVCKWTLLALPILMLSCSKDDNKPIETDKIPVTLSAGIKTRAIDSSWADGDCIGLTSFKTGTNTPLTRMHNCRYSTCGDGNFDADVDNRIYYPLDGSEVDLLGYYPYQEGLAEDHIYNVNVADQSSLPRIDLMTFSRHVGASKNKPNVSVTFKHRLTKLLFSFQQEDPTTGRKIEKLTISGMHTTGDFKIFEEACVKHTGSKQDIEVPVTEMNTAKAIVMPHEAGEKITFTVTLDDGTQYIIGLDESQELKCSTKYVFNILLRDKETPTVIKGEIQDWEDGGTLEIESKAFIIEQDPGQTLNFDANDKVTLYCGTTKLTTFTYNGAKWTPASPVYWENIGDGQSATVSLRAEFVRTAASHTTQLPELMLAETTVNRFEGVSLKFSLVPAKVVFRLKSEASSSDEEYLQTELNNAVIQLPDYINEYTLNHGVFTKGSDKGDIDVVNNEALIIPQSKSGEVAHISIGNNKYTVFSDTPLTFKEGEFCILEVNVTKTQATSFSASYKSWSEGNKEYLNALIITEEGETESFKANDQLTLFYKNGSNSTSQLGKFTYQGDNLWTSTPAIYWENLDDLFSYTFYATSILRNAPEGSNQMPDLMYAEDSGISKFGAINLKFTKETARVVIVLKSTDKSFTEAELETATVILPGYKYGAHYNDIIYVEGTNTEDITVTKSGSDLTWVALIQEQSVPANTNLIQITIGVNTYFIKTKDQSVLFDKAKTHTFTINISKAEAEFSASYSEWEPGMNEDVDTGLD